MVVQPVRPAVSGGEKHSEEHSAKMSANAVHPAPGDAPADGEEAKAPGKEGEDDGKRKESLTLTTVLQNWRTNRKGSTKGREYYKRGSIVMRHLEQKQATKKATETESRLYDQLKKEFEKEHLSENTMIGLSVFTDGENPVQDPFAVSNMPLEIQIGFRRKLFLIFAAQLLAVSLLMALLLYAEPFKSSMKSMFGSSLRNVITFFVVMLFTLFILYLVKYLFPYNFVCLGVYTFAQAFCFAGICSLWKTPAGLFVHIFLLFVIVFMTILTTIPMKKKPNAAVAVQDDPQVSGAQEDENNESKQAHEGENPNTDNNTLESNEEREPAAPQIIGTSTTHVLMTPAEAGFIAYFITLAIALIYYYAGGSADYTKVAFFGSLGFVFVLMLWFMFDASCLFEKMSPDEYMQGMIFFYTDMVLFMIFLGLVIMTCIACEGGDGSACCSSGPDILGMPGMAVAGTGGDGIAPGEEDENDDEPDPDQEEE